MEGRGKWAVIGVLLLGLILATFGWWWNLQRSKRCLEFWGSAAASTIRQGKAVTAFQLVPLSDAPAEDERLNDQTEVRRIKGTKDISEVRGLIHARNSLLDDASFAWDAAPPAKPVWTHALRFQDGEQTVNILFDLQQFCLKKADGSIVLPLVPQSQTAWRIAFGARYFDDPALVPEVD